MARVKIGETAVLGGGEPLLTRICHEVALADTVQIRFALGYLFVPGLAPVWDALEASSAREIHLLIGNTASVLTDEQRVAAQDTPDVPPEQDVAATARAERSRIVTDTAIALRENLDHSVARTPENARLLTGLARAVMSGRLRVRIYPNGRLHAKAYLFLREDQKTSVALVGSTNLTLPSHGNPTELNAVVTGETGVREVTNWFEGLWTVSQDFSRELVDELLTGWPLAT